MKEQEQKRKEIDKGSFFEALNSLRDYYISMVEQIDGVAIKANRYELEDYSVHYYIDDQGTPFIEARPKGQMGFIYTNHPKEGDTPAEDTK